MEFRDLKAQYIKYKGPINKTIKNVMKSANFIGGLEVSILEKKLASYVGVKHCITCANGTDAMTLILDAWDIKEGDAVFVPDFTYFATVEVIAQRKATPILIDVLTTTFNIDPSKLEIEIVKILKEGKLSPKAIISVDLFGLPADYNQLEFLANKYGLKLLEDSAQGFGGSINNKKSGSFGNAATTSFFPAKPLGCYGDGGAIFTNDDNLAKIISSLKVHGKGEDKYDNIRIGYNSRLDTLQAGILNIKFDAFVKHELKDVQNVFKYYDNFLTSKKIIKPIIPLGFLSSFAQYTIILESSEVRTSLQNHLKKNNVPTFIYYSKAMHQQKALLIFNRSNQDLTNSTYLADRVLSLPMHPYLKLREVKFICKIINHFFAYDQVK